MIGRRNRRQVRILRRLPRLELIENRGDADRLAEESTRALLQRAHHDWQGCVTRREDDLQVWHVGLPETEELEGATVWQIQIEQDQVGRRRRHASDRFFGRPRDLDVEPESPELGFERGTERSVAIDDENPTVHCRWVRIKHSASRRLDWSRDLRSIPVTPCHPARCNQPPNRCALATSNTPGPPPSSAIGFQHFPPPSTPHREIVTSSAKRLSPPLPTSTCMLRTRWLVFPCAPRARRRPAARAGREPTSFQ